MVSPSRRLVCLLLAASALFAVAMPPAVAQDAKLRPMSLLMYGVAPDLGDAPLRIVPHALGYFADEGLKVGVEYAGGSGGALQLLAASKGQFVTSTPTQVMLAKIARVFAILIIPAAIGISLHTAVRILHRRIVFWRKPDHKIES